MTGLVKSIRELGDVVHAVALPAVMYEADLKPIQAFLPSFQARLSSKSTPGPWNWRKSQQNDAGPDGDPQLLRQATPATRICGELISQEIDQGQLRSCSRAPSPLYLTVYANIPLMQTRVEMPSGYGENHILSDGRNVRLRPVREGSVTVFRSCVPLDWTKLKNPKVRVAQLVVDLTGSDTIEPRPTSTSLFNYDRRLR